MQSFQKPRQTLFLTILIFSVLACTKDDGQATCASLVDASQQLETAFQNQATAKNCGLYKAVLRDVINNDCLTGQAKEQAQTTISTLHCEDL